MDVPRQELVPTEHMVDYDRNSQMQVQMVRSNAEWLHALVERIGVVAPQFVMVDYGPGPGRSALDTVRPVIEAYRRLDPRGPMLIRHADQPGNDWNALFALVFGPDGYQRVGSGIRTEAAVGSFYQAMADAGSVALGTCFAASHWLSRAIAPWSPGTVWFADLTGNARAEMAALARADWTQFLRCRARELRPGGLAILSTLGSVPDAHEPNGIRASASKLYRAIFHVAHQMVRDGSLDESALDHFVFPLWFPTADEIRAPIDREPDLAEAFEVVEASVALVQSHGHDVYEDALGDPATYARLYAGYVRGFAESSLRLHLFRPSAKGAAAIDVLAEEFFRRFTRYYEDEPGRHASETMIASPSATSSSSARFTVAHVRATSSGVASSFCTWSSTAGGVAVDQPGEGAGQVGLWSRPARRRRPTSSHTRRRAVGSTSCPGPTPIPWPENAAYAARGRPAVPAHHHHPGTWRKVAL